jgi:hypothetical protein
MPKRIILREAHLRFDATVQRSSAEIGELVWHRLGNVAKIGAIRSLLTESGQEFGVLLTKVTYDGSHAGDWLAFSDVERLDAEMQRLIASAHPNPGLRGNRRCGWT